MYFSTCCSQWSSSPILASRVVNCASRWCDNIYLGGLYWNINCKLWRNCIWYARLIPCTHEHERNERATIVEETLNSSFLYTPSITQVMDCNFLVRGGFGQRASGRKECASGLGNLTILFWTIIQERDVPRLFEPRMLYAFVYPIRFYP